MNLGCSISLFVLVSCLVGCYPSYTGVDIPPTPVAWEYKSNNNIRVVHKRFDANGNAYILGTYDESPSLGAYELTKLSPNGEKLWQINRLHDSASLKYDRDNLGADSIILFDSVGNIYIVGDIMGAEDVSRSAFSYGVFSAKISADGAIAWENRIPSANNIANKVTGAISSSDQLFVTFNDDKVVHVLSSDAQGVVSEIYSSIPQTTTYPSLLRVFFRLAADDTLYLFNGFALEITHLSPTGEVLQSMPYRGYADEFIVNPDGTIYIIHQANVKKFALTGTLIWEKNMPDLSILEGGIFTFTKAVLSADTNLNIFYAYSCELKQEKVCLSTGDIPPGSTSIAGYNIVKLDQTGQEVGRVERYLPRSIRISLNLGLYGIYASVHGFGNASFQLDESNNLYAMEKFVDSKLGMLFSYPYFGSIDTESLVRKHDPTGKLTKQARTRSYPMGFMMFDKDGDNVNGPLFVNSNGALSIFNTTSMFGSIVLASLNSGF
jgi:hypothetical protein